MIQFTKEYQDIGVRTPIWQDIRTLVEIGAKGVTLGPIKLINDIPAGLEVYADPLIAKVFNNLIDNAVRYGGNVTNIHFFVEEHGSGRIIICEDDGVGISTEMKEKLFKRGSGKDHGVGLFISREILSITGMTIAEEGVSGRGAKFVMTAQPCGLRGPKGNGR
jgi:signal transduction histidine kinase